MSRILLLLEHRENCRLLSEWLMERYEVLLPATEETLASQATELLAQPFDLCIADGAALTALREPIQARRKAEPSVFLPVMLITARKDVRIVTDGLEYLVDELIISPIEKAELWTRVRMLLRSRAYSWQLHSANETLQHKIDERLQAEEALRRSELQFRQLAENITEIFWIKSSDQEQILYISPAYEAIWGRSCQSLYEQPLSWLDTVHSEDRQRLQASLEVEKRGEYSSQEFRILRPDGEVRWVWRRAFPVGNEKGQFYRITGIVEDITERKQAELEIKKALATEKELNQLKSSFVAMVSHEFRNPLNTISGLTQMLQRYDSNLSALEQQEMLQRIQAGVGKMVSLLDDVLVFGQAGVGKFRFEPAPLNLRSFCQQLINEIKFSFNTQHQIIVSYQGEEKSVLDARLLHHILTNLLSNAVKYAPEHSTVQFTVSCQPEQVIFQIQDQGIGIAAADQQRLFETFYRASNVSEIQGTGLGLAIVKQCVDLHGGAIAVNSEVGSGTTFTVTMPNLVNSQQKQGK